MATAPRILLVDNDPQILAMTESLLKQELPEYPFDQVVDRSGLARALEAGGFCLVITDYQLDWTNGLDIFHQVKARWPDCPVIMFTATGTEEIAVAAMKAGLDDYVLKSPKHIDRLTVSVRAVLTQVEERRRARECEAVQRSLINDVLDAIAVGLIIYDAEFRVVWVNQAFERFFGLHREGLIGVDKRRVLEQCCKQMVPDPEGSATCVLATSGAAQGLEQFECHVTAGPGREERWLKYWSQPISSGLFTGGRVDQFADITERKRAEEGLREISGRFTTMIHASPIAITVLDLDGRVQLWNPAAHQLFQWSEAEVLGHPLPTVPPERLDEHRAIRTRVLCGETIQNMEVLRRRKDGSQVTILLSIVALRDTTGTMHGYLGMMTDVTERKQMEAHGRRLEQLAALGQLLGGIAHEMKNPLFVLTGYLQLVREKLANREYAALPADLSELEAAANRMVKITDRFLAFSRPYEPRLESCAVHAVLRQTLELLQNELMKNRIQVTADIALDLPAIRSDPHLLQQAFLNLILNAMQAMVAAHGQGTLNVSAAQTGEWITVRIQDDGPGIAPEHQLRLFEPFFTTKPFGQGTGLGLWMVRTNVMALKGLVTCETEVGRGTTFIVRLPIEPRLDGGVALGG